MERQAQLRVAREGERQTRDSIGRVALIAGAVSGVGAFVVSAVFMGLDYFSVREVPPEHAVVVSVGPSGTEETCGPKAIFPNTPGESDVSVHGPSC